MSSDVNRNEFEPQPYQTRDERSSSTKIGFSTTGLINFLAKRNFALILSLSIVAVCFFIIGGVGWELSLTFQNTITIKQYFQLRIVSFVLIFTPIIGSMFLSYKIHKLNPLWFVLMIILFTIGNTIGFALLFTVFNVPTKWLFIFVIVGVVFFLSAIIGYFSTWINRIWKYVIALTFIWFIVVILLLILRFAISTPLLNNLNLIVGAVFAALTIFYIMYSINQLRRISSLTNADRTTINLILLISFRLLLYLTILIQRIAYLVFRFWK